MRFLKYWNAKPLMNVRFHVHVGRGEIRHRSGSKGGTGSDWDVSSGSDSTVPSLFGDGSYIPETGHGSARPGRQKSARFGNASSYRREVAPTASGQCDLRTVFPKVISGLRRPIAIQAATSLNMNLPE